jgi:hypothetical protein
MSFETLSCSPQRFLFRTRKPRGQPVATRTCEWTARHKDIPCHKSLKICQNEKDRRLRLLSQCRQNRNVVSRDDLHKLHLYLEKLKHGYFTPQDWKSHEKTSETRHAKVQELQSLLQDAMQLSQHPFRAEIFSSSPLDVKEYLTTYRESDDLSDEAVQGLIKALDTIRQTEVSKLKNFLQHHLEWELKKVTQWNDQQAACFLTKELLDYGEYVKPISFKELIKYYSFLQHLFRKIPGRSE